jgi:cytochrome c peroxidase
MRNHHFIKQTALFVTSITVATLPICAETPDAGALREQAKAFFKPLPDKMPGSENDTPDMVKLGERLFRDTRLSQNNTQSCNSCHSVDAGKGGVDNEPTSPGAFGKRGGRNSPTVLNAGLGLAQFWDGRAATLEDQAKGPVLNPVEMAMPDDKEVIRRLAADADYKAAFAKIFGGSDSITYDNYAKAVAAFERTLITRDRFDDFLKGDDNALNAEERKGLSTFVTTGCIACHTGPLLGGTMYQKMGLVNAYENQADLGRHDVTKNEADKFFFKVPTLRNIALTAPYFHDGKAATLNDAVKQMAWLQLGKKLSDDETKSIATFLSALTDKQRAAAAK